MSTTLYDLGLRLRAAEDGAPAPRMHHAPRILPARRVAVAVERDRRGDLVVHAADTAASRTAPVARAHGADALAALAATGVSVNDTTPPALIVADRRALAALAAAAQRTAPGHRHADAAAVVSWWDQRADHAGSPSVLDVTSVAAERWALGTAPTAERDWRVWARWLNVTAPGPLGLLDLADVITAGEPLPGLDTMSDQQSWEYLQRRTTQGWDWRRRDHREEAALGLVTRTHAGDLYESLRLQDPLHARRERHAGTLVAGVVAERGDRALVVESGQALCRLRRDSTVEGWGGAPDSPVADRRGAVSGRLAESTVTASGGVTLTLTPVRVRGELAVGDPVTLRPEAVNPSSLAYARRTLSQRYGTRGNWLASGRAPAPRRRAVPLDVLVAAADED